MNQIARLSLILAPLILVACKKHETPVAPPPAPAVTQAPAASTPAAPAEPTPEQAEKAAKQELLNYNVMEDKYMHDEKAQWASTAKASSVYGDPTPNASNLAKFATGPIDDNQWVNNNIELGFDWLELGYAKPVQASEVRLVLTEGQGAESLSKVELQDTDGKWNVVWEGISETKKDKRGARTWVVRSFEKTPYKVKSVKYTFANNLEHGYKYVEAAQLVGE